ncbi:MAG TPA: VTT domain-containing protein, partial [Pyrinomonadaceae bacterium]|nr:VTT domain-containing protein [Pyrinomonadaceae bacterium]
YVYVALFFIIFAETGLAVGFFLPGDSLLVVAGLMAKTYPDKLNIFILLISLFIAGVLGDAVGYYTGKKMGKTIFNRPKSWFFRPEYLRKAHDFYEKHGGKTIIMARFVPIVRTFAPMVAGAADMTYRKFVLFNIFGGFLWVFSMLLTGYFVGELVENAFGIRLQDHIEKVVIVVILLSLMPPFIEWMKARREKKRAIENKPLESPEI